MEGKWSTKEHWKNWARLIKKIYEVAPLICRRCQGKMKVITFIEDEEVIKKILNIWDKVSKNQAVAQALTGKKGHRL